MADSHTGQIGHTTRRTNKVKSERTTAEIPYKDNGSGAKKNENPPTERFGIHPTGGKIIYIHQRITDANQGACDKTAHATNIGAESLPEEQQSRARKQNSETTPPDTTDN